MYIQFCRLYLVEYADYDVIVKTHLFALFDGHFSTFSIWNFPELN